jgi:hypothetical protein
MTNIDSKELNLFPMKFAFLRVAKEFRVLKALKRVTDALDMLSFCFVMI